MPVVVFAMGNNASNKHGAEKSLQGKCAVAPSARKFTMYLRNDVLRMLERYKAAGSPLALNAAQFEHISGVPKHDARACFQTLDTDCNGLVDACETLATICAVSCLDTAQKLRTIYDLFDFGKRGALSLEEIVILFHAVCLGVNKLDDRLPTPSPQSVEGLVRRTFARLGKTVDDEVSFDEYLVFCNRNTQVKEMIRFIDGAAGLVDVRPGEKWRDPDFDCIRQVLHGGPSGGGGGNVFGRPSNFCWQDVRDDAFYIVPDACEPSRVCPGYFPGSAVASALNLLAGRPKLVERLFVTTGQESIGRFTLQLFYRGEWSLVSVDDRVLCSRGRFCAACGVYNVQYAGFSHAMDNPLELWPNIVTKALAKKVGSFAALAQCGLHDVLEMLTAGACHIVPLPAGDSPTTTCLQLLHQEFKKGLVGAVHQGDADPSRLLSLRAIACRLGIVPGSVYVVRGIKASFVRLVCCATSTRHRYESERLPEDTLPSTAPESGFWMHLDDFSQVFEQLVTCSVFDPAYWSVHARRATMRSGGDLQSQNWFKNDQYCLTVSENNTLLSLSAFLAAPMSNKASIAIAVVKHDFGDDQEGEGIPLTVLLKDTIHAMTAFDQGRKSNHASLRLEQGKYVIMVLVSPAGQEVEYSLLVRARLSSSGSPATTTPPIILNGSDDIEWQDLQMSRDEALSKSSANKETKTKIKRYTRYISTRVEHNTPCQMAQRQVHAHLHALLAHLFEKHNCN